MLVGTNTNKALIGHKLNTSIPDNPIKKFDTKKLLGIDIDKTLNRTFQIGHVNKIRNTRIALY